MLEIQCLHCFNTLDIPEWVNTDKYDGEISCKKCGARLAIKFVGSTKPVKYKVVKEGKPRKVEFNVRLVEKDKMRNQE